MKFMLLMQGSQAGWESMGGWPKADLDAHIRFMGRLAERLAATGELVSAEGLDLPSTAKIVRSKNGEVVITDGPFPESKEFLAGFWLVDVASEARAIAIASEASEAPGPGGAPQGIPIEVRRLGTTPEVDDA